MLTKPNHIPLILVVDDDAVTRQTLVKVLSQSGYEVIDAENGREAFSSFIERRPSLVLLDAIMPEMNGYETIQAIRHYEQDRATPILMLTALDDPESIEDAFKAGATDFITKPINWKLLVQRVKYVLRSSQIEDKLRTSQSQLVFAQKLAKLGYWEWDALRDEVTGSESVFDLFGIPKQKGITLEQFLGNILPKDLQIFHQGISEATQGYSQIKCSLRSLNHNGNFTYIEIFGEGVFDKDNQITKITGSAQDISRLHKAESLLKHQKHHDSLTKLPNRSNFTKTLNDFLLNQSSKGLSAVIIFDIDRFKEIHANIGQEQSENLLISIAHRLTRIIREKDNCARLSSDEFAILIRNVKDQHELNLLVNRLAEELNTPFTINGQELFINYSMGVSVHPKDAKTAHKLINHANIARAKAESLGGNQFTFYHPEMDNNAKSILLLENDLRRALENNEIEVFYQPQVNAHNFTPTGAEALVRWRHPTKGIISPNVFIPLAESTGMIVEIGQYVLETAVKDAEEWHALGYKNMQVGINLSSIQFTQFNLMKLVQNVTSKSSLPPHFINLEITESVAMSNAETNINLLNGLKAIGVSLSIDDFGTGYSSLSYLHRFPIDTIKIDRSFVLNLDTKEGQGITNTILAMAKSLDLEVVTEGIELDNQIDFFKDKHCHVFQGYKFGKPMPKSEFLVWLKAYNTDSNIN